MRIEDADMSIRAKKTLRRLGILSLEDACRLSDSQISRMPGCGKVTIREIRRCIRDARSADLLDDNLLFVSVVEKGFVCGGIEGSGIKERP